MPLFGKLQKNPADIVKTLKENMAILEKHDKKAVKASEEVSKCLQVMKEILYGTNDKDHHTETVTQLAQELYSSGLLISLIKNLKLIDFESEACALGGASATSISNRSKHSPTWPLICLSTIKQGKKDVSQIFNNILRRQVGTCAPTVDYICSNQHILFMLLKGYEMPQVALNCGIMLRECIRHEPLAKIILLSEHFSDFFRYVEMSTFDIASDAFATFKDLLTRHKALVAEFLDQNYDMVFNEYEKLLHSENYVTKRQSLKVMIETI
uniref:Calcium binding protein 39 like n=1 Tax=Latimeria chalumnae TaxID=7897 RepID=H3AJQ4_LATCH